MEKIVTAAIVCKDGQVLVARRAPGQSNAGFWEFPGGKQEPGETERACLAREMREELGVEGVAGAYIGEGRHAHPKGEIVLRAYRFCVTGGRVALSVHDEMRYVSPGEFPLELLTPADRPLMQRLADQPALMEAEEG